MYCKLCKKEFSSKTLQLYDTKKKRKLEALEKATFVALTGDHWTSISNCNYFGPTTHFVEVTDGIWHLQSFALTVQKTNTRQNAENYAGQFLFCDRGMGNSRKDHHNWNKQSTSHDCSSKTSPIRTQAVCCSHPAKNNHGQPRR